MLIGAVLLPLAGCGTPGTWRHAELQRTIPGYENFIRANPHDSRCGAARDRIFAKASRGEPWDELNRYLSQFNGIDGARYDEQNDRLVIWGPADDDRHGASMPPLLIDDFIVALTVLNAGENPGVSIGTIRGRVPTQADIEHTMRTQQLPIEYIPASTQGTHMGSILFEVDRALKGLAHGEDNLTRRPVTSGVPGYRPVGSLLQADPTMMEGKPRPLGLWWFVPDETGIAFEGYTIKFVRYRMRVEYKSLASDPAVEVFGKHLGEHFDEFATERVPFRELVRLHKLVQVARWFKESGFPTDRLTTYAPVPISTPDTTKMIQTEAGRTPGPYAGSYYIMYLIGGVDLSPRNTYAPAAQLPASNLVPGYVGQWKSNETYTSWRASSPPQYGTFRTSPAPVPSFAKPIFHARPAPAVFGWTARVGDRTFAVASIPTGRKAPVAPAR